MNISNLIQTDQGTFSPQAAVALAGFPVGESYVVPWTHVQVPEVLRVQVFPFCEDALAKLRVQGCKNQGTINFLELLQSLRPFFWRVSQISLHLFHVN